ncbi:hypothetical protein [Adhaeribacter soli]|uniref:Uncharacterized protein n=1 Tax=Adhaeribacter soli TaxID=2607655 RepID=A0A5N1IU75_9BACT|nr:hypothetical protein [Adhaeribacter soli]KAA9331886.1 hypothetical protein F0P94_13895 [Adhaeribacter soli]
MIRIVTTPKKKRNFLLKVSLSLILFLQIQLPDAAVPALKEDIHVAGVSHKPLKDHPLSVAKSIGRTGPDALAFK